MGNGFGIGALICAIIGFFCCGILSVVAIILGAIGIGKDDEPGMAKAGLILGIVSLVVGLLVVFFLWGFIATMLGLGSLPFP
jgi:hypothetical protein